MKPFEASALKRNEVMEVYRLRDTIDTDPPYQRQSDVWSESKKQLFIDSLINGYDVPKLYFHELPPSTPAPGAKAYDYAVVDGKQRLQAIWGFLASKFDLSDDFEFLEEPGLDAAGLGYEELALKFPRISNRLELAPLPIVVIQTRDLEIIEEMFARLNEAVPLNAPEKRNAFGGPLPVHIRILARHDFCVRRLPYGNNRYRHLDLATKFLYVEFRRELVDTKKRALDEFVRTFKNANMVAKAADLAAQATATLDSMASVFQSHDHLLSSVGMVVVYFELFRAVLRDGLRSDLLDREGFEAFEATRDRNKTLSREIQERQERGEARPPGGDPPLDPALTEFDRLMQSPNDVGALKYRLKILRDFLTARADAGP